MKFYAYKDAAATNERMFLIDEVKMNWTTASKSQNLFPEDNFTNFYGFVENLSQETVIKDIEASFSPVEGMPDTWVIRDIATGKNPLSYPLLSCHFACFPNNWTQKKLLHIYSVSGEVTVRLVHWAIQKPRAPKVPKNTKAVES